MLTAIFHTIVEMNITASAIAALLLLVKFIFQKLGFPRRVLFLLWIVIAFRLACPISISTDFSPLNLATAFQQDAAVQQAPAAPPLLPEAMPGVSPGPAAAAKADLWQIGAYLWAAGVWGMLLFGAVSYLLLKRRLRFAVKRSPGVYLADGIPTSFVFGIWKTKIYIAETVSKEHLPSIILHERTHIKRGDHITKFLAYLLLSFHWINPLNWLLFRLFSNDMELACDEAVVERMGLENKRQYLYTLLQSAVNQKKTMFLYHVSFSVNPTKQRIKHILTLKKRSKFFAAAAALLCLLLIVSFGTNASTQGAPPTVPREQQTPAIPAQSAPLPTPTAHSPLQAPDVSFAPAEGSPSPQHQESVPASPPPVQTPLPQTEKALSPLPSASGPAPSPTPMTEPGLPSASPPPPEAENTDANALLSAKTVTAIQMGTHIADVHRALGVGSVSAGSTNTEICQLDNGNSAVLIYEDDRLKSGYILKGQE